MTPSEDTVGSGDDEDDPLRRSLQIITSLSASIADVRCFQGRWSAVSATLGRLASSLSELSSLPPHPLSTALLLSLPPTLSSALTLSRLCASPSPAAGKLRTQSDLSSLSLSLTRLSSDADLLLRSGALLLDPHGDHLRPLLTQLQMGGPASLSALSTLPSLSDKALAAAAASHSLVPSLLRLLDSPSRDAKRKAAAAVARISTLDACAPTLALDGGADLITALARALESDDASAEPACAALQTLTLTRDNAMALASRGSIPSLLAVCQGGTPPSQAAAAAVLKNLAAVLELRRLFVEENAVPVLRGVLSFGTAAAGENAVGCLSNLAAPRNLSDGDEERQLKLAIVRDGGLDCVKSYWEGGGDQRLEPAIELLRNLASFHYIGDMIVSAGFLPLALSALSSTVWSVRTEAARLIAELASTDKVAKEAGELNCMNRLVGMMEAKSAEEMESAVRALDSLLLHCKGNRRQFRRDEKGIVNVVQLLDPLLRCVEKKYPVSVLLSVSESWRCRKQMVAAGAHGFLLRLAEGEVEGAKRLLESLGKGKLWGVFPRA